MQQPSPNDTVVVDCGPERSGMALRVAGMSVLERILREYARRGVTKALLVGNADDLPNLPALPLQVTIVPASSPVPDDAEHIAGDELTDEPVTAANRRAIEWQLLQTCRRPYDGPTDKYILRSMSLRITRVLTHTPITPNMVTFVAMLLGTAAVVLLAMGTVASVAVAGVLMFANVILDSVDGELSRVRHMGSKLGMWLDGLSDDIIDNALVAGMGVGIGGIWLQLGIAAALGRAFSAFVTQMGAAAAGHAGDPMAFRWWFEKEGASAEEAYSDSLDLLGALRSLGRRDTYMFLFAIACVATVPQAAFALGVANSVVYFCLACVHLIARRGRF